MTRQWNIVHGCDDDDGNPTCWFSELGHKIYGRFIWITMYSPRQYNVEVSISENSMSTLSQCTSLDSAERWVSNTFG